MNTLQLETILSSDPVIKQWEVIPFNHLPSQAPEKETFFVLNTDSCEGDGTHWFMLRYCNRDHSEIFCSFGQPYEVDLPPYVTEYTYNPHQIQSTLSVTCGHHVIYVIFHLARGWKFAEVMRSYDPTNLDYNDQMVYRFVCDKFGVITDFSIDMCG